MKKIAIIIAISLVPAITIAEPARNAQPLNSTQVSLPTLETIDEMSRRGCYYANLFYQSGSIISNNGVSQYCTPNKQTDMPPHHVWSLVK